MWSSHCIKYVYLRSNKTSSAQSLDIQRFCNNIVSSPTKPNNGRFYSSYPSHVVPDNPILKLKARQVASIARGRHPWIFGTSLQSLNKNEPVPTPGTIVDLITPEGSFLARGFYNQQSRMAVRVLTWDAGEQINSDFWRDRLEKSIQRRQSLPGLNLENTDSYRLINSESDLLPGLVVDKYADWLVMQVQSAGISKHAPLIQQHLVDLVKPRGIYERSDDKYRQKEGLSFKSEVVYAVDGSVVPDLVEIKENGTIFFVDVQKGHKTGFYLDQRDARDLVGQVCKNKRVLNCFSYTGGFSLAALKHGASKILNVDQSASALQLASKNVLHNDFPNIESRVDYKEADVFEYLRELVRDGKEQYDVIILDPPKFASSNSNVETASRGYKDIARLAFSLLPKGGILASFSCSAAINPELFQQITFSAVTEAGKDAQIIHRFGQPPDHPVSICFPEGHYLKGLLLQVI